MSDAVIPSGGFWIYLVLISSTGLLLLIRITSKLFNDLGVCETPEAAYIRHFHLTKKE